jgi:putative oxidoreductase
MIVTMEKITPIARYTLGFLLIIFGVNGFYNFLGLPEMPDRAATVFQSIGYLIMYVKMFEVLIGLALLVNVFVPLALIILTPISINILLFHIGTGYFSGILPGAMVATLNIYLIYAHFDFYRPFLMKKH